MPLSIEWIGNFDPFNFLACPICAGKHFTSLSAGSIWCDKCNTRFSVRHTAGDPGCVVDADTKDAYGQTFECPTCSLKRATLMETLLCPHCKTLMEAVPGYSGPLSDAERPNYYLILKTGDYCSGWLKSGEPYKDMYSHPSCKDATLQSGWEEFQRRPGFRIDPARLPEGVRFKCLINDPGGDDGSNKI